MGVLFVSVAAEASIVGASFAISSAIAPRHRRRKERRRSSERGNDTGHVGHRAPGEIPAAGLLSAAEPKVEPRLWPVSHSTGRQEPSGHSARPDPRPSRDQQLYTRPLDGKKSFPRPGPVLCHYRGRSSVPFAARHGTTMAVAAVVYNF